MLLFCRVFIRGACCGVIACLFHLSVVRVSSLGIGSILRGFRKFGFEDDFNVGIC